MTSNGVFGVMNGPWLIVKWFGIGILLSYVVLLIIAIRRFRGKLLRVRSGVVMPIVLGNFVSLSLPWVFMKAEVTRGCFVAAQGILIYGIVVLIKNVTQKNKGQADILKLTADS